MVNHPFLRILKKKIIQIYTTWMILYGVLFKMVYQKFPLNYFKRIKKQLTKILLVSFRQK